MFVSNVAVTSTFNLLETLGCVGWYKFYVQGSHTVTEGKISQINDYSGLGHHLLQPSAMHRPRWDATKQTVEFDLYEGGINSGWMQTEEFELLQPCEWFLLSNIMRIDDECTFTDGVGNSIRLAGVQHTPPPNPMDGYYIETAQPAYINTLGLGIFHYLFDAANSFLTLGGVNCVVTPDPAPTYGPNGITINAKYDGDLLGGQWAYELIVFNRALTGPERTKILNYLQTVLNSFYYLNESN